MWARSSTKRPNSGLMERALGFLRGNPTVDKPTSRITYIISFHENLAPKAKPKAENGEILGASKNQSNSRRGEAPLPPNDWLLLAALDKRDIHI